ncbi:MAG: polyhydroxyalkanoate synthesis regulator DNA-binding domain-containing protein [Anaerolineae bacterium]
MPIIKRYSNRKLYDTQAKRYITLEGVAKLIRKGQEVQVTDHETGEDITALVQAQTILELEKKLKGGLPGTVLTHLIRAGNDTLSQMRQALMPREDADRVNAEIERRIRVLVKQGALEAGEGKRILELLVGAGEAVTAEPLDEAELLRRLQEQGIPTKQDWQALLQRIDALNAEMEQLAPRPPPRRAAKPAAKPRAPRRK